MSNPFQPIPKEKKPKVVETDYHKDIDKFIIEYGNIQRVKITGEKDTDFVINEETVELDRIDRQSYYDSFSNEVGILNIIQKVRLSGDTSLLNQTNRVPYGVVEKDALGHDVEPIVDVCDYQVDKVQAFENYKEGVKAYETLDPELKKKLSLEGVAKLSDAEIDSYIESIKQSIISQREKKEEGE